MSLCGPKIEKIAVGAPLPCECGEGEIALVESTEEGPDILPFSFVN